MITKRRQSSKTGYLENLVIIRQTVVLHFNVCLLVHSYIPTFVNMLCYGRACLTNKKFIF